MVQKPMVIVIPSYNNKQWYKRNLASVFKQRYSNCRIIYIDDCSSDGTADLVEQFVKDNGRSHHVTLIRNEQRVGQLANHYTAVHMCNDEDIVVNLDGDDWFSSSYSLARINSIYAQANVWITFGQYINYPEGTQGGCRYIPENYDLRQEPFVTSHQRTFYAWLFKLINADDLRDHEGKFFQAAADVALMLPMLEMAGPAHRLFVPHILYVYNRTNPLNIFKQDAWMSVEKSCPYCPAKISCITPMCSHIIRYHRKKYELLTTPIMGWSKLKKEIFYPNEHSDLVIASMASVACRKYMLKQVVDAILPQIDKLNVFLNGYDQIPDFLYHPKITVASSTDYTDLGDVGKFFWADTIKGYHFTIDDDLIYPSDYVENSIKKIEQYKRKAVIGYHGILLKKRMIDYYADRKATFVYKNFLASDMPVHILGTGALAYHTDTIKVERNDFLIKNMADIWFGVLSQKQKVSLICVQRPKNYIIDADCLSNYSIFNEYKKRGRELCLLLYQYRPWFLHTIRAS